MTTEIPYSVLLQKLNDSRFAAMHLDVSILRSDTVHPVISGNKWMKLLPWIKKARESLTNHIISKGGPWSNHLHAAAYTCMQESLKFTAVVKAVPGFMTKTLDDVVKWNANIIYADHEKYMNESFWENQAFVEDALYIPMGGEGEEAVAGVSAFFNHYQNNQFDYVICPVGTATTFIGIAFSNMPYKRLIGIDPGINDSNYHNIITKLSTHFPERSFTIINDPTLKKFGKWPEDLPAKMNTWFTQWELPTDIIYTAKMFAHFERFLEENYFETGSKILLVHTGGLQGNRSLPGNILTF